MGLPGIKEIDRRISEGEGLTRPELALMGAFVKLLVYADLVEAKQIDMEGLRPYLRNYFPEQLQRRFGKEIDGHHLGREIALTRLTNRVVDLAGATFFSEMNRHADAGLVDSVQAYSLASRLADLWTLKDRINALPGVGAEARYRALLQIESGLKASSLHLLESWSAQRIRDTLRNSQGQQKRLRDQGSAMLEVLDPISRETALGVVRDLTAEGFPEEIAVRVARSRYLPYGLVILDLAENSKRNAKVVARDYFSLGRASGIFAAVEAIDTKPQGSYYESLALKAMRRDLLELVERLVVKLGPLKGDDEARLEQLGEGRRALEELSHIEPDELGPASLLVSVERIRSVLR
jgi:glutamate dehydrogenase